MKLFKLLYSVYSGLVYFICIAIIAVLFLIVNLFVNDRKANYLLLKLIRFWFSVWAILSGIRIKVIDRDKVPNDLAYVFVCNHQSNLDAMIWGSSNIYFVKGLAKKELMKIPILGFLFRKTCVIVDRSSKESRKASFDNLRKIMQSGISIFFFPEGTRNKTDKPLQPFYDGAFRAAVELQEPLAPLVMCDSSYVMPNNGILFTPGTAKCVFLDPIPTKGLTEADIPELKQRVFDIMEKAIIQHDRRF